MSRHSRPLSTIIVICITLLLTTVGHAADTPLVIGEHMRDVVLETPHPYPAGGDPEGKLVWSDHYEYPQAAYLVFEFKRFDLAPGDRVEVRDPAGKQVHVYRGKGFKAEGGAFITKMILGSEATIDLYSSNADHDYYGYSIERITRGYSSAELETLYGDLESTRAICGGDDKEDAVCYETSFPDVYDEARAVARIVMDGSALCTAWLVSCENHVMTNNHCTWDDNDFDTQGELDRMEFQFMYEEPTCGGGAATVEYSFMGGTWLENHHNLDYTLIQAPVGEDPASTYGWLLIDDRLVDIDETIYIVGHPSGRPKEISLYSTHASDQNNPDGFCEVFSQNEPVCVGGSVGEIGYFCDTEGGNSGSPVLSRETNKVVALHHCANCPNRGVRIQNIWATNQAGANALPGCSLFDDIGSVKLDASLYSCSATVSVEVNDGSIPGAGTQDVTIWSGTETTPELLTLTEMTPDSGKFGGTIALAAVPVAAGDGILSVSNGDTLTVRYIDADDGQGGTNIPREKTAAVDCAPPVITNVQAGGVTGSSAIVTWNTDEPANSEVSFSLTPPAWSTTLDETLVTDHEVKLSGLEECSVYGFRVSSSDGAGNSAADDNGGLYYDITTGVNNSPEFTSSDTPLPIVDNTTFTSAVTVDVTDTVLDVDVRLNITHTYDGDLDIFLIGPDDTRVELTSDNGGTGENFVDTVFDDEALTAITAGSAPFTGSYQPEGSLATLDGQSAVGAWTLEVTDDAGVDTGELVDWTLILTFEAMQCGPIAEVVSHQTEVDACATGSPGLGNDQWDAGEQIEFSVTVHNDGTDAITGATVTVTPLTAGVTMIDDSAPVANLAPGQSADTSSPHLIAQLSDTLTCGSIMDFDVAINSAQGSWPGSFSQMLGELILSTSGTVLTEDFNLGLPAGWTVVDGFSDGDTWFSDSAADPAGCRSVDPNPPFAGSWATVDSSCTGGGTRMDEELITPVLDLVDGPVVTLEFDHWFEWSPQRRDEMADVDVRSSNTGGQWVNVARWTAVSSANTEHAVIDISTEAGDAPDVEIRFRYHNSQVDQFWYIDNVLVHFFAPEICNMTTCAPASASPPPIPADMFPEQLTTDGSEIAVHWNDQCAPFQTKIVYGALDQVASYAIDGSVCSVSAPQTWTGVPVGDLWFLVISDDGVGIESSWGQSSSGERNGLTGSGTCGSTAKDISGSCP